jgi:hypothetical protein
MFFVELIIVISIAVGSVTAARHSSDDDLLPMSEKERATYDCDMSRDSESRVVTFYRMPVGTVITHNPNSSNYYHN